MIVKNEPIIDMSVVQMGQQDTNVFILSFQLSRK